MLDIMGFKLQKTEQYSHASSGGSYSETLSIASTYTQTMRDKLQLTLVLSLRISVDKMTLYLFIFVTLDPVCLSLDS